MVRALAAAVVLLSACKEAGPTAAQLKAERQKVCDASLPRLRAKYQQLEGLAKQVKAREPLEADERPHTALKLSALRLDEQAAKTDANYVADFDGPKRGIVGSCLHRVEACSADDTGMDEALARCDRIDSAVIIRPTEHVPAKPTDVEGKYKGGFVRGDAFVFSLADGKQLGAVRFDAQLSGDVEIYRDFTTAQIEAALDEGLRKAALRAIETRLNP